VATFGARLLISPHAALHQPPRGQAQHAEARRRWVVEAIELPRRRRFAVELDHFRHRGLHAEGELVRLDAGAEGRVVGVLDAREPIEPAEQIELALLFLDEFVGPRRGERQRIARIDVEADAGVLGPEVVRAVAVDAGAGCANGLHSLQSPAGWWSGLGVYERQQATLIEPNSGPQNQHWAWR
jgi:hypothetical protein